MAQHAKGPQSASGAPEDPADEIKRRMREALERKNQQTHTHAEGAQQDGSEKMHGLTGHVDTQNYRRKAGGGGS
ncbi:DUF5302 domain-containing protein [Microlunatus sp. Y2014]|uniref:DUF5302 domain-containing protein n=1 Tax=Microlunatus sp. Y2014 TaxID=3418488 RepID=UPI003DA787AF